MSSINDAGNSGAEKFTYKILAGYDHKENRILEIAVGADVLTGGGGVAIAESVMADATRIDLNVPFIGSATDNANDVIKTFVRHMQVITSNIL